MSEQRWISEVKNLGQLRDELKLKAHLLKAELQDQLHDLEKKWDELGTQMHPVKEAAGESAKELGSAVESLVAALKKGYERIKEAASDKA
jgi:molybdopterin converting factor small subunit